MEAHAVDCDSGFPRLTTCRRERIRETVMASAPPVECKQSNHSCSAHGMWHEISADSFSELYFEEKEYLALSS